MCPMQRVAMDRVKRQWSDEETQFLLSLWSSTEIQHKLEHATRTKPVFQRIQREMAAAGYEWSVDQIINKIKKLKKDYRDRWRDAGLNGNKLHRKGPHFDLLHSILGDGTAESTGHSTGAPDHYSGTSEHNTGTPDHNTGLLNHNTGTPDHNTGAVESAVAAAILHAGAKPDTQPVIDVTGSEAATQEDEVKFTSLPYIYSSPTPSSGSPAPSCSSSSSFRRARPGKRKQTVTTDLLEYLERSDEMFLEQSRREEELVNSMLQRMEDNSNALISLMGRMVSVLERKPT